jgi:hypothetical protein
MLELQCTQFIRYPCQYQILKRIWRSELEVGVEPNPPLLELVLRSELFWSAKESLHP